MCIRDRWKEIADAQRLREQQELRDQQRANEVDNNESAQGDGGCLAEGAPDPETGTGEEPTTSLCWTPGPDVSSIAMATPAPRMSSTFMSFDIAVEAEMTASEELPNDTPQVHDDQGNPMAGKIWDGAWSTWRPNLVGPSTHSEKQIFYNLAGWWSYILPSGQQYAAMRLQARRLQERTWDTTPRDQLVAIRNILRNDREFGSQVFKMVDDFIIAKGQDPKDYGQQPAEHEDDSSDEETVVEDVPMPSFGGIKRTLDDNEEVDAKLKRVCVEMDKVRYPQNVKDEMERVRSNDEMDTDYLSLIHI